MSYIGNFVVIVLIVLHLLRVEGPLLEVKLLAAVVVIGAIWETTVVYLGLMAYPHDTLFHGIAPLWILALWASFAAQFNTTYRWLKQRVAAGALLGAIAGPLSFRAGAALGAVRFVKPWPTTVTLAAGWAVILSLIILLSRRWDGVRE
jgi:hypothetical protein